VGPSETYTTVGAGIAATGAGDTLIVRNGTYYGTSNDIAAVTGGTSTSNMTTIMAETDWGVTLDMNQASNSTCVYLQDDNYVEIRGFHFTDSDLSCVYANSCEYVYIRFCSVSETSDGNHYGFSINDCLYGLVEDCFTYGRMRYAFGVSGNHDGGANYTIFRRCVARLDYFTNTGDEEPNGAFIVYQEGYVYFQNCIAIDGLEARNYGPDSYTIYFYNPNGANNTVRDGCIAVNNEGGLIYYEGDCTDSYMRNCLFLYNRGWNDGQNIMGINGASAHGDMHNCSFFYNDHGEGLEVNDGSHTIQRIVSYGDTIETGTYYMVDQTVDSSALFGGSYTKFSGGSSTNDFTTSIWNPTASYTFPTTPDSASQLWNQNMGCRIRHRTGTTGTFYGVSGWNTTGTTALFPLDFEDEMQETIYAYNLHGVDGTRGWAGSGKSLGEYINEFGVFPDNWGQETVTLDSTSVYIDSDAWTFPQDIEISSDKAVASFMSGIKLYSLANITFTEKDEYWTGEDVYGVDISADTAFFGTDSFLYKVQISGDSIAILDSITLANCRDVELRGDSVWVLTSSVLRLYDFSLSQLATTSIGGNALTLIGDTIVVARNASGVDFRDAQTLSLFRNVAAADVVRKVVEVAGGSVVYIDGTRLYKYNYATNTRQDSLIFSYGTRLLTVNDAGTYVFPVCSLDGQFAVQVSDLSETDEYTTDYYEFYRGTFYNNYNIIGAFSQDLMGFHIYNVSNPASISLTGSIETNDYVRGCTVNGDSLYVATGHYGVACYNIKYNDMDYAWRIKRNSVWNIAVNASYVAFGNVDGYLFLANKSGSVLDSVAVGAYDLCFNGTTLYVSCTDDDGLRSYSTTGDELTQLNTNTIAGTCYSIDVHDDTIYTVNSTRVYSFNTTLTHLDSLTMANARYLSVTDDYVFVSKGNDGDELMRLNHELVASDSVAADESRQVYANDNYVYLAREEFGFNIYTHDFSITTNKTSPYEVYDIIEDSGLLYVAERSNVRWIKHTGIIPGNAPAWQTDRISVGGVRKALAGGVGKVQ
jgi:hypothetical protein